MFSRKINCILFFPTQSFQFAHTSETVSSSLGNDREGCNGGGAGESQSCIHLRQDAFSWSCCISAFRASKEWKCLNPGVYPSWKTCKYVNKLADLYVLEEKDIRGNCVSSLPIRKIISFLIQFQLTDFFKNWDAIIFSYYYFTSVYTKWVW